MRSFFDRILPPPRPSRPTRPEELLYAEHERPPLGLTLVMGVQHAFLSLMFILYAVVAAQGIGLAPAEASGFVSATIFMLGAATLLQAVPSRLGAGMILVALPAPSVLPGFVGVTSAYGLGAAMGATIVAGLAGLVLARVLPRMRAFFPPEVLGVVVVMLGLSLVSAGLSRGVGLNAAGEISGAALASAAATILSIIATSLWGPPGLRRMAVVIGALAGTLVAVLAGATQGNLSDLSALPALALPMAGRSLPTPEFLLIPIAVFLVTELIGMMDVFGTMMSMEKMNDARWRRADMGRVARAVTGSSLLHVAQGCAGLLSTGLSSANVGLAHATGVLAWRVGAAAGIVLMAAAFVPPIAGLLAMTPAPVIGGILIYTAAYLLVAGMGLATSRMMNTQRSFTVGLALVAGAGVMLLPALGQAAPDWSRIIVTSGLTMGSIAAVALNAVLRIGVRRNAETVLDPREEGRQAAEFLDHQGRAWGARAEVVVRAGFALGEALEALRQAGTEGPVTLAVSFDEFNLRCRLLHAGPPVPLGTGAAPDAAALLDEEEDAALDAAMRRVSAALIARLADRVRAVARDRGAELVLEFEH